MASDRVPFRGRESLPDVGNMGGTEPIDGECADAFFLLLFPPALRGSLNCISAALAPALRFGRCATSEGRPRAWVSVTSVRMRRLRMDTFSVTLGALCPPNERFRLKSLP